MSTSNAMVLVIHDKPQLCLIPHHSALAAVDKLTTSCIIFSSVQPPRGLETKLDSDPLPEDFKLSDHHRLTTLIIMAGKNTFRPDIVIPILLDISFARLIDPEVYFKENPFVLRPYKNLRFEISSN